MKYFKVKKGQEHDKYEVNWDNFVKHTKRKYPFEQLSNNKIGKSFYAFCPHCENTVQMVGVYENKPKKHAAHTGKAIKGFSDYDYFGYNHCIYASNKPAYNRDARKTDFDENAKYYYNITKENFDRVAYILRNCLDVYLNNNILLKSLEIFHNSNGFLSPYISKSNIPWIICELGLSGQNLFGQHIKKDSAMYKAIEKIPAALFAESTIEGYSKLTSKPNHFLNLQFRFADHTFEMDDDHQLHEFFELCIDDMVNEQKTIYKTKLKANQSFFPSLTRRDNTYRDTNLLEKARDILNLI